MEKSPMKKKKWFTPAEKTLLRQLVRLNSSVINTGRRKGVSVQAKKKTWQNITDIYNDHPSTVTHRTVIELRRCWDCMKFYAKKKNENITDLGGEDDMTNSILASQSSTESSISCSSSTTLQHLALHPHLLATILSKGEPDDSVMQSSVVRSDQDVVFDHKQQPQQTLLDSASATDNCSPKEDVFVEPLLTSPITPCPSNPTVSCNTSNTMSGEASSVLSSLRCEQLNLRRRVVAGEALLLQQFRRHALHEHQHRLARDREEHQARLDALKQDFALKKIIFRVQVCQMQADASVR